MLLTEDKKNYLLNDDEYITLIIDAIRNGTLKNLIEIKSVLVEVCYKNRYFKVNDEINYMVSNGVCAIFTSDEDFVRNYGFFRVGDTEYEKTLYLKECSSIRITHFNNDEVLYIKEIDPLRFIELTA